MRVKTMLVVCGVLALSAVGCGDAGGDDADDEVSCGETCDAIAALCGTTPPGCEATCATWSASERRCVVGASSCLAADACGDEPDLPDGGQPDAGGPDAPAEVDDCPTGWIGLEVDVCPDTCRHTSGLGDTGTWCSGSCSGDESCPQGYVCNTVGGYCTYSCEDDAACSGFDHCNLDGNYCTF